MRLTLRTLLAWLDDTLPPNEVRQIGHQVADSPFAQELVERIHRVTRQRRLTVPGGTANDATDPNLVAAYLDNELAPEPVADYEKKCLTSDVHLAEVASVHQILSLIGQKAKVPAEARYRMYRLVKGREAVSHKAARAFSPPAPDPLTEPLVPWAPPEPPQRSPLERYGPPAFVLLLILVLIGITWYSLSTDSSRQPQRVPVAVATPPGQGAAPKPDRGPEAEKKVQQPVEVKETIVPPVTPAPTVVENTKKDEAKPSESTAAPAEAPKNESVTPPGSVGVVDKTGAAILRYSGSSRTWEVAKPDSPLKNDDRVVNLDHFRNLMLLGPARVALSNQGELQVHLPEKGLAADVDWVAGRLVVYGTNPPLPIAVHLGDAVLKITPPAGVPVGLETAGDGPPSSGVRIYAPAGNVSLAAAKASETLVGPGMVTFTPPETFTASEKKDPPGWVTDPAPSALDKQLSEQFARVLKPDQSVIKSLLEAMDDDQKEVRQIAISALGAIGQTEMVVEVLRKHDDQPARIAAIKALRSLQARGGETADGVKKALVESFGEAQADTVLKLLTGYNAREAREEATYRKLVVLLTAGDPAIRELALDNLMRLTGRDSLGYDPDQYEGPGLKNWQELLNKGELNPQASAVAPATK